MKKGFIILVIIIGIVAGVAVGMHGTKKAQPNQQVLSTNATQQQDTSTPVATEKPATGIPQTIEIPKLNIKTTVESVGNDAQGRMGIPKISKDTAWYSLGYRPGAPGSAVIAGHYDNVDGSPSVFYYLRNLQKGDQIFVTDDTGKTLTFEVTKTAKYPDADFPIQQVFGAVSEPMLNLITCNGTWDAKAKNYSDRLVVYSTLATK